MKNLILHFFFFLIMPLSYSQNVSECDKIVMNIYDGINQKNAGQLMSYLSDDFSIAGQTGEIAKLVFPQLINQLNTHISNIQKKSETKTDVLTLVYTADFSGMGTKTSTFIFDKDSKLKEMDLLKMAVQTKASAVDVKKNNQDYFSVPFKRYGNIIVVKATLNGEIKDFIVDNGSPIFILNNAHSAEDSTVKKITSNNIQGIGGTISNMDMEEIQSFDLQGISMSNQKVTSVDLSHLEKELKVNIAGLIGYELLKDYDLLFDYKNHTLTFINPAYTERYLLENFTISKSNRIPIEMEGHLPVVKGEINGEAYSFGIDCGSESNLLDIGLKSKLERSLSRIKKDKLSGADTHLTEVSSGKLNLLKIGNINFKKSTTVFSDISAIKQSKNLDGLIGYPVLSRQLSLLSYKNKFVDFIIK